MAQMLVVFASICRTFGAKHSARFTHVSLFPQPPPIFPGIPGYFTWAHGPSPTFLVAVGSTWSPWWGCFAAVVIAKIWEGLCIPPAASKVSNLSGVRVAPCPFIVPTPWEFPSVSLCLSMAHFVSSFTYRKTKNKKKASTVPAAPPQSAGMHW